MINSLWLSDTIWRQKSGSTLVPDGTKPLPEPMLTYHQQGPVAFIWEQFHKETFQPLITKIGLKITQLIFQFNLPGANELNTFHAELFWGHTYITLPLKKWIKKIISWWRNDLGFPKLPCICIILYDDTSLASGNLAKGPHISLWLHFSVVMTPIRCCQSEAFLFVDA